MLLTDYADSAPVVDNNIPNQQAREGLAFSYQIPVNTFSDPNGDILTYSATTQAPWLSFDPATRIISGIPVWLPPTGAATVTVRATDPSELFIEDDAFAIFVSREIPTLDNPISDQTTNEGDNFSFQFAADTFSDPNSDPLAYTATIPVELTWLTFDPATRTFSGMSDNASVDIHSITRSRD